MVFCKKDFVKFYQIELFKKKLLPIKSIQIDVTLSIVLIINGLTTQIYKIILSNCKIRENSLKCYLVSLEWI